MTFMIPEAESLVKRGFYRRAATIYKQTIVDYPLTDSERDTAMRRFNDLTHKAEQKRIERAGNLTMNNDPDYGIFNATYSGPSSVLTLWGCKN